MMLEAKSPVRNTTTTVSTRPRPGTWRPKSVSGWSCGGRSVSTWSIDDTIRCSTQSVIASGIQIRRPVMRYFFKAGNCS